MISKVLCKGLTFILFLVVNFLLFPHSALLAGRDSGPGRAQVRVQGSGATAIEARVMPDANRVSAGGAVEAGIFVHEGSQIEGQSGRVFAVLRCSSALNGSGQKVWSRRLIIYWVPSAPAEPPAVLAQVMELERFSKVES